MIKIKLPESIKNVPDTTSNSNVRKRNKIEKVLNFFKKKKLFSIIENTQIKRNQKDIRLSKDTTLPDLVDLYVLYSLVENNNRINILEYGTGWSSIVILKALMDVKKKKNSKSYTRVHKPYNLTIVDADNYYLNISKKRILSSKYFNKNVSFNFCKNEMILFQDRYATRYKNHPVVNPDFIFLDGPDQWSVKNKINNFTTGFKEMMPMASDILHYEFFLTPGTIILTDGRTNNVNFLKAYFKRNWKHIPLKWADMHILLLQDEILGPFNKEQIEFYK